MYCVRRFADWLDEVLSPHVQEIVVVGVRQNRGPKSDKIDAFALAEKLRIGAVETRVYKKQGAFGALGELCRACNILVADSIRVQNRIKSLFRSRGIPSSGRQVYSAAISLRQCNSKCGTKSWGRSPALLAEIQAKAAKTSTPARMEARNRGYCMVRPFNSRDTISYS